ncbi:MAG: glycosyltransferase family 2 protein [Acidobacteria bacterium]|nr:glycosyltransferase family 2 protein [Acidobacteriota bacterium]
MRQCLVSLRSLTYPNYKIVVVDNDSGDGTEEMLRNEFPELAFIQTGNNLGYTGGNNKGIEYAIKEGADYILIINPDTVVANPKFIDEMVEYAEAHPDTGIAGPRIFLREAGVVQNTVLFPPGLWQNTTNWIRYRISPKSLEFSGDEVVETEVLNGVCLLIRVTCLRQIGLFDENIFMYIEDAEMDYRAHRHGWRVQYLPIDSVIHQQKQDGYQMTGAVSFLLKRNSVYYLCKIGRRGDAWGYAILSLLLLAVRAVLTFNRNKFIEYAQFCRRLAVAYQQILLGRSLDKSFGPPFAQL